MTHTQTLQTVSAQQFEAEVLHAARPVLVDFTTEWCGPCRALAPLLRALADERPHTLKVVAVDGEAAPELVTRYRVRGYPTVVLFDRGEEVGRQLGLTSGARLAALVDEVCSRESTVSRASPR